MADRVGSRKMSGQGTPTPLVISRYGAAGASTRVRIRDWLDHCGIGAEVLEYVGTADNAPTTLLRRFPEVVRAELALRRVRRGLSQRTVLLSRGASPFSSGGIEASILKHASHSVYDFDDALYAVPPRFLVSNARTWLRSLSSADTVIAGSEVLAENAAQHHREVVLIPSCVEPEHYVRKTSYTLGDAPRAVWIGSPSTERFLLAIAEPLLRLHARWGLRLTVISAGMAPLGGLDLMVDRHSWNPADYARELSRADFGIMPLPDTPVERGKCAYKLLQYAATGLPMVGSPVGANRQALPRLGGLAASTSNEWYEAIEGILDGSTSLRAQLGDQGRHGVLKHYSFHAWRPAWLTATGLEPRRRPPATFGEEGLPCAE